MARLMPDPFETLFNIQRSLDASRASDWLSAGPSGTGSYPPLNVFRQGDDLVVITELPGIDRNDVEVQVQDDRIRISGKKTIQYQDGASLHRREQRNTRAAASEGRTRQAQIHHHQLTVARTWIDTE